MGFEIQEGITRADVAFRITGEDLSGLFLSGSRALLSVLLENPESIVASHMEKRKAAFENTEIDLLLFDFLQEIIFYKDAESLILRPLSMNFSNENNKYKLKCVFNGEKIDSTRHKLNLDVKAVTMHNLSAKKTECGWTATFVLDV